MTLTNPGPARPRRSRAQLGCLSALALLILLVVAFSGFEYSAWHGEVDRYTYIARGAQGQVIAHVVSHDAKSATALRQWINDKPILIPPENVMGCTLPLNSDPIMVTSYMYTFFSSGRVIETAASDNPTCGHATASCGGVTIWLGSMTPTALASRLQTS